MKFRFGHKPAAVLLLLLAVLTLPVRADELRQRALNDPLDCALYSFEHDENHGMSDELYRAFFDAKRYDDTLRAIRLEGDGCNQMLWLAHYAEQLIEAGDPGNAEKFVARALEVLRESDWWTGHLFELTRALALLGRDQDIDAILAHQDSDESRGNVVRGAASGYSKTGNKERTLAYGKLWLQLDDEEQNRVRPIFLPEYYLNVNAVEEALALMKLVEADAVSNLEEGFRNEQLMSLVRLYLRLGKDEKAWDLWHQVGDATNPYTLLNFTKMLVAAGRNSDARPLLVQLEGNRGFSQHEGDDLAELFLKIGDVDAAARITREMSDDDDNYDQQRALMLLADRYMSDRDTSAALGTVDLALQKARRVGETHRTQDSNGASPLTRKRSYLHAIINRYFKLGRFDRALAAINSFKTDHQFAREFVALSLVDLAEHQVGLRDRRPILKLLDQAIQITKEKAIEGYSDGRILMSVAGAYAKMGEQDRALALMARIIRTPFEDSDSPTDELIEAGVIFEKNQLTANAEMRRLLRQIVEDADESNHPNLTKR
jgi:hypothetical protein